MRSETAFRKLTFAVISIAICMGGCEPSPGMSAAEALGRAAGREFGSADYACDDTVGVAAEYGMDYRAALAAALARDKDAIQELMNISAYGRLDAASSQGHAAVLGELILQIGDAMFAECLARCTNRVRKSLGMYLRYDLCGEDEDIDALADTFPRTYRLIAAAERAKLTTMPDSY